MVSMEDAAITAGGRKQGAAGEEPGALARGSFWDVQVMPDESGDDGVWTMETEYDDGGRVDRDNNSKFR